MSTITIRKMPIVEVDKEYKIPLKQVSDSFNIKPADRFLLRAETKEKIILEKIKHKDSLIQGFPRNQISPKHAQKSAEIAYICLFRYSLQKS